ncbi:MAG TPA: DUF4258 domain-containing protein [Anaerolineae bacterium]|nr:DUF4258 domain-containing protein [Anaerolineae bacterium]HQK14036.1 DUF4258 domain-containing protein [Anaerolineae bacterium]
MIINDTEDLLSRWKRLRVSDHALREAYKEGLRGRDILHAIFNGQIVEHYPKRRRLLIAGPVVQYPLPIHVVCDYTDKSELVAVTVYIPNRPRWINERIRGMMPGPVS